MSATTLNRIEQGTSTDLLTTQLNSLADNTMSSAGSAVNNAYATSNFNGYPLCSLQLILAAYTGTPSAGAAIYFWFLKSIDGGSTYEDGSSSLTPARQPDAIFQIETVASGPQKITLRNIDLPAGYWEPIAKTVGMGLTLASSGNKITCSPNSFQGQ
jgi:hypothetical protein